MVAEQVVEVGRDVGSDTVGEQGAIKAVAVEAIGHAFEGAQGVDVGVFFNGVEAVADQVGLGGTARFAVDVLELVVDQGAEARVAVAQVSLGEQVVEVQLDLVGDLA